VCNLHCLPLPQPLNYRLISALPLRHNGKSAEESSPPSQIRRQSKSQTSGTLFHALLIARDDHNSTSCDARPIQLSYLRFCRAFHRVSNVSQGAWGPDLFQSDDDLDTVAMLDDLADLDKVKHKILANPIKYSFPKVEKSEDASDKEEDTDDEIDNDHIYMTLYNPSHPVSQV
jgi:hypothetical protein